MLSLILPAVEAACAMGAVVAMAWYTVARVEEFRERIEQVDPGWAGLVTVALLLTAGGLLAFAFDRTEDAVEHWRERSRRVREADD
ncbi:MAG: hypothetical protein AB7Y46_10110 [Armatimonadota bacterium]